MKTCKKHIKDPVICYSDCAGCEMQRLTDERNQLKAENEALRKDADKWKIVQRCMDLLQADERNASIWSVCSRLLISTAHKMNSAISTVLEEGVTIGEEEVGDWRVTVERVNMSKEG